VVLGGESRTLPVASAIADGAGKFTV